MQKLEVNVPDELARELRAYEGRMGELLALGLRQLKVGEALALYDRGLVSFDRAVELAGVTREELVRQTRAAGIRPRWTEQMVREELA